MRYRRIDRYPYPLLRCGLVVVGMSLSHLVKQMLTQYFSGLWTLILAAMLCVWAAVLLGPAVWRFACGQQGSIVGRLALVEALLAGQVRRRRPRYVPPTLTLMTFSLTVCAIAFGYSDNPSERLACRSPCRARAPRTLPWDSSRYATGYLL